MYRDLKWKIPLILAVVLGCGMAGVSFEGKNFPGA